MESHVPHYTHTPLVPAIERLPPVRDTALTMLCVSCGDTMRHFRTIAKLEMRPEQLIFVCPSCKGVDNKELTRVA